MSGSGWIGGARRLGGDGDSPEPNPPVEASSSRASQAGPRRQAPQRGLRTLGDLQNQNGTQGHDDGDRSSDDDYEDDENQDLFAGGEKSGLAVQNPNTSGRNPIDNILRRARQNLPRPGGDDERPTTRFRGTGMTLGGDDAPSVPVPDPHAGVPEPAPRVIRQLHLWRDGFSVDDGDLYRYDDPANAQTLELINSGHAPLNILNVRHDQEVDVEVHPHKDEDYKRPKKKYVPFSGSGQRLGSPTPGAAFTAPPATSQAAASGSATAAPSSAAPATVDVDDSVPTVTLQIRLGDGTRLQSRFNTTHTIGDVYSFVDAASPTSTQREYVLMTTFPSKELADKGVALGDMAEFKRGGVVVQKWKV